jgi:hypothetical protein
MVFDADENRVVDDSKGDERRMLREYPSGSLL